MSLENLIDEMISLEIHNDHTEFWKSSKEYKSLWPSIGDNANEDQSWGPLKFVK